MTLTSEIETLAAKLGRRDVLSNEETDALVSVLGPPRVVPAGGDFVQMGERPSCSTLLIEGFSARYSVLADGGRQITEINVSGDFVDLHSLLMKQMDHGVTALTDCVIASAPHAGLIRLTEDHPHLARLLWLDTIVDAAIHRQWLVAMGRRSGVAHVAHLVCELYVRLEVVNRARDFAFALPLSQSMLADALGLSPVHVSRLTTELRDEGLLRWSGGQVEILDWSRLTELAEFDPSYLRLQREPV